MNAECHFIQHTFHHVSVYFVLNNTPLRRCPSHTLLHPCSQVSLAMFSGIVENLLPNFYLRVIDDPWSSDSLEVAQRK